MPGFDGTGPAGKGPVTGGGFGMCNSTPRRGAGRGRARFANYSQQSNPQAPKTEKTMLEEQLSIMQEQIKLVTLRLDELKPKTDA